MATSRQRTPLTRAGSLLESYNDLITQMMQTMDTQAKNYGGYLNQDRTHNPLPRSTPTAMGPYVLPPSLH